MSASTGSTRCRPGRTSSGSSGCTAARGARRPAGRVPRGARRRDEWQVDGGGDDRAAAPDRGALRRDDDLPARHGWSERIRVDGAEADFEQRSRSSAGCGAARGDPVRDRDRCGARGFAAAEVDAAVVEAGLGGGSTRRTSSHAGRPADERRARAHGRPGRHARGDRPREARGREGRRVVVLPDDDLRPSRPGHEIRFGGAREAAEAFVGHPIEARGRDRAPRPSRGRRRRDPRRCAQSPRCSVPRRAASRSDGLHARRSPILADKDADGCCESFGARDRGSSRRRRPRARALPADELARLAAPHFDACRGGRRPAAPLRAGTSSASPCS